MSNKMAVSDLHSRLDFLVAYSSQLVFVANDDLQFQQSTLQTFIAQQHENLEVAFLKGEPNRSEEDYRKEICRQILHKTTGQFDSSLRTVLQDFDSIENPVLICLCAAQQLPHKLLKELWELVLLARSLNKNLHVNVVLFGDSKWVNDAKKRLPINSGNKPVVLSAELDDNSAKQSEALEHSELDALIANKRAAFAERIQARSSSNSPSEKIPSLIQTGKFQLAVGLVFLATFAALVFWFYPQQTEPTTAAPAATETQVDSQASPPDTILDETIPVVVDETVEAGEAVETGEAVEAVETGETGEILESDELLLESENETLVDELLVTQWQSPQVTEPKNQLKIVESLATDKQPTITEMPSVDKPVPFVHPLVGITPGQFLIQISSTGNLQAAERFIIENTLQETTWIYTTERLGDSWHVIVYKKLFQSNAAARNYIATLSDQLKNSSPFIKSIEKIQEEIASAN